VPTQTVAAGLRQNGVTAPSCVVPTGIDVEAFRSVDATAGMTVRAKYGVEIVPDIATLLTKVDAVLLESGDGRVHLSQARPVIAAHKPLFIDKPLAATLEDAREIARLAREAGVAWFSSSSLRFGEIGANMKFPDMTGAITWGPGPFEPHHYLDLSWYAVHPIELLYTIMGRGCETVTRTAGQNMDAIVGRWKDGRVHLRLTCEVNGEKLGNPDAGTDAQFGLHELIAHAAKTRDLAAGTMIGTGTISNHDLSAGFACLMEARLVEQVEIGAAKTPFLHFGDSVRLEMRDASGTSVFGAIEQKVIPAKPAPAILKPGAGIQPEPRG